MDDVALIVGTGSGLSASLARLLAGQGMRLALAARNPAKLAPLASETGAAAIGCDATDPAQVEALFAAVEKKWRAPDLAGYNASDRVRGPIAVAEAEEAGRTLM